MWLRATYAPLFFFGFLALGIWIAQAPAWPLWTLVFLLVCAIVVALVVERIIPYQPDWNGWQPDTPRDLAHAGVNESLNLAGVALWSTVAAAVAGVGLPRAWPDEWPLAAQVVLAIVLADVGFTLAHYASHRIGWLWRLHAVHHSLRRMYGFNGLMKHPLHQGIEAAAAFAPLLLLGAPQAVVALVGYAAVIQLLLQHSNADLRMGPLRHVFAWAPVHRFHHVKYGRSGDVNFGFFLTVWDRLLGTAFWTGRHRVNSDDLGIGTRPDFPVDYGSQLIEPFRAPTSSDAPATPEWLSRDASAAGG